MMSLPLLDAAIAEKTWREACLRVLGQHRVNGCLLERCLQHPILPFPPINDPAAAMVMLAVLLKKATYPRWMEFHDDALERGISLALATAVVALPKEKP